jgi:hypothetical protein
VANARASRGAADASAPGSHIPELVVSGPDSASSVTLAEDAESQFWRDKWGHVVGRAFVESDVHFVEFERIGRFSFRPGSAQVWVEPHPGAPEQLIVEVYHRWVLPVAVQVLGPEVLHASGVLTPDGVVGFCAASESGKSTLAYGLSQRGFRLYADDALAFEIEGERARALPLPFSLRLRPSSAAYFDLGHDRYEAAHETVGQEAPIQTIFLLRRGEGSKATARRVEPLEALPDLLAQSYHFGGEPPARKRRMLESYLALVTATPLYDLHLPTGVENLPAILDEATSVLADLRGA